LALLRHSKIADGLPLSEEALKPADKNSAPSTRPRQRRPHPAADPRSPEIEKATETGRSVRVLLARPGAKRHVVNEKPPTLDGSMQAIDRAIRSRPPMGHPATQPWMLDFGWTRAPSSKRSIGSPTNGARSVACSKCDWRAAFSRDDLIATHGADHPMPNLLNHLAAPGCSRLGSNWDRCGVHYVEPIEGAR